MQHIETGLIILARIPDLSAAQAAKENGAPLPTETGRLLSQVVSFRLLGATVLLLLLVAIIPYSLRERASAPTAPAAAPSPAAVSDVLTRPLDPAGNPPMVKNDPQGPAVVAPTTAGDAVQMTPWSPPTQPAASQAVAGADRPTSDLGQPATNPSPVYQADARTAYQEPARGVSTFERPNQTPVIQNNYDALDQAFIKAFTQQSPPTMTVPPRSVPPAAKALPIRARLGRGDRDAPTTEERPKSPPQRVAEGDGCEATGPVPAALDGVLAVLERPPRASTGLLQTGGPQENARRKPAEEQPDGPCVVDSQQWTVGSEAWAVDAQPWALSSEQWAVDVGPCPCPVPTSPPTNRVDTVEAVKAVEAVEAIAQPSPRLETAKANTCGSVALPGVSIAPLQQLEKATADVSPAAQRVVVEEEPCTTTPEPEQCETPAASASADAAPACDVSCVIPLYPDKTPPAEPFQPAWRVDHFTWPKVCRRLIARAAEELDRLADALAAAGAHGQKVLAMAGCHRGEGATTLLLCVARRLAERGAKLVLVDADLARPRLASRLGVQPQCGWEETTSGVEASLAQAVVEATGNNLALLPAREPPCGEKRPVVDPSRLGECLEILRGQYDMVLVDLGPLENAPMAGDGPDWMLPGTIDGVVFTPRPAHHHGRATDGSRTAIVGGGHQGRGHRGELRGRGLILAGLLVGVMPELPSARRGAIRMYETYWRLNEKPFENSIDPRYYYPSESHQAALLKLRYAIENRRGSALLAGPSGAGKTVLTTLLRGMLGEKFTPFVHLVFPQMSTPELLGYLADELDGDSTCEPRDVRASVHRIERFLTANSKKGHHAVVALDEAHLIEGVPTFEALRLLMNFQPGGTPALTLLLAGQPALLPILDRMPQWEERLGLKCLLRPFSEQETAAYVEHRLKVAGAQHAIIEPDAIPTVHALTHGIARRINRLCDLALLIGYAEERSQLDAEHFEAVSRDLVAVTS